MRSGTLAAALRALFALSLLCLLGADLPRELVAHYDFEETSELDGTVKDKAGPPFSHGRLKGRGAVPEFVDFEGSRALVFEAKHGQYVDIENAGELSGAFENGLTIEATIKIQLSGNAKGDVRTVFSRYDFQIDHRSYSLHVRDDPGQKCYLGFGLSPDGKKVVETAKSKVLDADKVIKLVAVFDPGRSAEIYADGKLVVQQKIDFDRLFTGPAPVAIGCRFRAGAQCNCFSGIIDNVKVWAAVKRPSSPK